MIGVIVVAKQNVGPLQIVQELGFALVEMNLYLDSHPDDTNALAVFNDLATRYATARSDYEAQFGPLLNFGTSGPASSWTWVQEPWPWQV
jgi:spore coat protein JB